MAGQVENDIEDFLNDFLGQITGRQIDRKAIRHFIGSIKTLASIKDRSELNIAKNYLEDVKKLENEAADFTASVRNQLASLRISLDEVESQQTRLVAVTRDTSDAVDSFKTTVREELRLAEARRLWDSSAKQSKDSYVWSWIVLVALLILFPIFSIVQSDQIFIFFQHISRAVLSELPSEPDGTALLIATVSRLVLVTLPVFLYVWLIRIVVRFNARSLVLMDDARQRNTMLETYLHLVEQDATVKADRPLILEALFRRAPGHGPETIEPVNLADILRIGAPTPKL